MYAKCIGLYEKLLSIGMISKLALSTLISLCSIALVIPVLNSLTVLGEITVSGTMIKEHELVNSLQFVWITEPIRYCCQLPRRQILEPFYQG